MALKSVVVEPFFLRMVEALEGLKDERGPLAFALLESNYRSGPTTWNLSIAARWLDAMELRAATVFVSDFISNRLGELKGRYASTKVRRTNDYVVRTLVPLLDVSELGTAYSVQAMELSLFNLDEVVVLLADPTQLSNALERIPA